MPLHKIRKDSMIYYSDELYQGGYIHTILSMYDGKKHNGVADTKEQAIKMAAEKHKAYVNLIQAIDDEQNSKI